jgi:predicted NBD/HSP70 family sugar kinase
MDRRSPIQPILLSKMNELQVLRTLLQHGPSSRAELARLTAMTPPTVSKAVDSLLLSGHLEEQEPTAAFGRPAKRLGLAAQRAQVLGLVIDADWCRVAVSGLDGQIVAAQTREFPTPDSYAALIAQAVGCARALMQRDGRTTLGMGISIPGLVDYRRQRALLSPNVPLTNGQLPGRDLAEALGIECVLTQEEHALCLAERYFGSARGLDDFVMLDVSTGVGMGVMSGGRLLQGRSGLAGEIGHITVDIHGRCCGCGNRGCLETVACDSALAWQVSQRLGRRITIEEILAEQQGAGYKAPAALLLDEELELLAEYLAVGLAAVINLFNPDSLFVHGRLFELDDALFAEVVRRTGARALAPSFAECRIVQARGSKRQGAIATIIEHLFEAVVPTIEAVGSRQ